MDFRKLIVILEKLFFILLFISFLLASYNHNLESTSSKSIVLFVLLILVNILLFISKKIFKKLY